MKPLLIIITAIIVLHLKTNAQGGQKLTIQNFEQKAQQEADTMGVRLSLSSVQKDSVFAINKDYYQQIVTLHGQTLSLAQRIQQYASAEQVWKDRLAIHLSSTQYNQYFQRIEQDRLLWQHKSDSIRAARNGQ